MNKLFIFFIMPLLFFSCCKDYVEKEKSLFGEWQFNKIDSVYYFHGYDSMFLHGSKEVDGKMFFNCDSTGELISDHYNLSAFQKDFIWSQDQSNDIIDLSFVNGTTFGFVEKHIKDSLTILFRNYINEDGLHHKFYRLYLVKEY